jgi:hypothetical protein
MAAFCKGMAEIVPSYRLLPRSVPRSFDRFPSFVRALREALRCRDRKARSSECCVAIPASVHKRADPLLYSQSYLMMQGLAVTWDNPDIQLSRNGVPVSSQQLDPDTEYDVEVRIWNGSYDAPALNLPVRLSFRSFGAGTALQPVGGVLVDLGAKGTPQCPAFARFKWRTPRTAGHHCLQASLIWPDDANPANNVGQENTLVGTPHSPAEFHFQLRNASAERRAFDLAPDSYQLPEPPRCDDDPSHAAAGGSGRLGRPASRRAESEQRWAAALRRHGRDLQGIEPRWSVAIEPARLELQPWQETTIRVLIASDDPGFSGRHAFNVACFATGADGIRRPAGGVTLYVERE